MESTVFLDGRVTMYPGDCRDAIRLLGDASIDSVVTDPPYALVSIQKRFGKPGSAPVRVSDPTASNDLKAAYARASAGFMGQQWDTGETAFAAEFWTEVLRVLKPGGHVVAFSGTRTYHRMVCAIEDAGFEIRDQIGWCYATGFPKSHSVTKSAGAAICRCPAGHDSMRGLRQGPDNAGGLEAEGQDADMLPAMQRCAARPGVGETRAQGLGGRQETQSHAGRKEPRMEGRRDISEAPRELRSGPLSSLPTGSNLNGEGGRLRHGASAGDGAADRPGAVADGMRTSSGSQAAEQCAGQSGTLAVQPQSQAGGAWENCARCGKPMVPEGLGTALKPAWEPICLARKPLIGTVAENVLEHGTGAINVDGCRVGKAASDRHEYGVSGDEPSMAGGGVALGNMGRVAYVPSELGRWPANIIHDGSEIVVAAFPQDGDQSAARFFYSAKADADDRLGSKHPTVKPVDLMQWLVRLVTPKGGLVLDPFAGTGTTGEAAFREGMNAVLIEREEAYQADIARRMELALAGPDARRAARTKQAPADDLPMFAALREAAE